MFTIPQNVQQNALSALALYEKSGQIGSAVAKATATKLSRGGKVDESFVRKLSRYYPKGSRAEDPILSSLWGGVDGKMWADVTLKANFSAGVDSSVRIMEFTLDPAGSRIEGDYRVYPNSFLFQAGNFPDKKIEITPEDLALRVANSEPCYLNLEHTDLSPDDPNCGAFSALDGILGEVTKFWIDPTDPTIARGEVHVMRLLDDNLQKRGLSMEVPFAAGLGFDGGAITYTPRITQAAMMSSVVSEFKKKITHTASGISRIQSVHDDMERAGAVCKGDSKAKMATAHEADFFQSVHDMACAAGAECRILSPEDTDRAKSSGSYYYSKEKNTMPLNIKGIKSLFAGWFSAGMPEDFSMDHEGVDFSGVRVELDPANKPAVITAELGKIDFTQTAEFKEMTRINTEYKAKLDTIEAEKTANFAAQNTSAIEALLVADKILPANVEFCQSWRAKDPAAFDVHFATQPALGNLPGTTVVTVDADDIAKQRTPASDVDLTAPFSMDALKVAVEAERKLAPRM